MNNKNLALPILAIIVLGGYFHANYLTQEPIDSFKIEGLRVVIHEETLLRPTRTCGAG